ncbi:bifunctional riboflavin kinase/FAD synthetase [Candidatus Erwinia haradaeae]|uniref:Riboflavin biosynthesis protein n=1 Tax=Candidatus Erwinia haradaeae TaxID=1922217 RepID=A0A451D256_9GAMM|nr:bifunctional riboflavin kinase/FAD synthetase [Candidatus Erwinia haradaeae]VFP79700.1 Bifunctional riboflavin kinase/FMN adenylyltransferase [Candidatus Erwinia haradaeae]
MRVIRGINNLRAEHRGCVLTVGNFDGVHRGHQALLAQLHNEGCKRNAPVMVMLFEPHPLEIFNTEKAPARLTRLHEKLHYLKKAKVDVILCIRFNHRFSSYTAKEFIIELLVNKLGIKFLAIGEDFRFGADRYGTVCFLQKASMQYGFDLLIIQTLLENNRRISSTAIRNALAVNNLSLAKDLLGRSFSMCGRVVYGDALGRKIGFPTINLLLFRILPPVTGVYIVYVKVTGNKVLPGVANIGIRPTFKRIKRQLEVHLLDINIDLYGQYIEVIFLQKIRDEKFFSSLFALQKQIQCDIMDAKYFFNNQKNIII